MALAISEGRRLATPNNPHLIRLKDLADEVHRRSVFHCDSMVRVDALKFHNGIHTVFIDGEEFPMRLQAQRQIAARLEIPYNYLVKCPVGLQEKNLHTWLLHEQNEELFFRFDRTEVRAIFTPRYKPLDNMELICGLYDQGYDHDTEVQATFDAEFLNVSIVETSGSFDIGTDSGKPDLIYPSIGIANSEVGLSAVSVSAAMWRLVCSNGLIGVTTATLSKRHISLTVLQGLGSMIEEAQNGLKGLREQFQISVNSRVQDPDATMARLNKQLLLSKPEIDAAAWGYMAEPAEAGRSTMFHIANAYTKGAQFPQLDALSATRLQRAGGQVLAMVCDN